ncbi:hypothetical protein ACJMK2_030308 [Sinanodonta woodiana]|uniref:DDE Tnp4 domain-containing protein n=1 Tax=Sinanodonta woodiana TaxID=1069815 RepID=A0ABD3XEP0_SINWO
MISYISETWGGRASDKQICVESGFLNLLDPYDLVMANRGFAIKEELLLRRARLAITPGARGKEKMSSRDVKLTQQVANLRIHVEEAINRLKMFKMLKETSPITLLPTIDDSITVIAKLCIFASTISQF